MPPQSPEPQLALGRAIRLRREELGLSQKTIGLEAGLQSTYIAHVESGRQNPSWGKVDRIARVLKLSLWELAKRADELETAERRPTNEPLPTRPARRRIETLDEPSNRK
jgi:transcriptional regulator with XRE-family HTH domain